MENIRLADRKARRKKKHNYGIRLFDRDSEAKLQDIHRKLVDKRYKTSEYKVRKVFDQKERIIYVLPYSPDRIVHHAIMNVLEPIWNTLFIKQTYSCIKKRGTFLCAKDTAAALHSYKASETVYCLKIDIRKFYPSIDHGILKTLIRKKIKCANTLWLLDEIIESAPGVPIGNYLSQFFANIYLAYFDHWVKEVLKVKHYFRYADDIVVLSTDKNYLRCIFMKMKVYLKEKLRLEINKNHQIFEVAQKKEKHMRGRAIDFVGFCIFRKHILIRKRIKKNFCKAVAKANKKEYKTANECKTQFSSWLGWCKYSDSVNLAKKIIKPEYFGEIERTVKYNYRKKYYNSGGKRK